MAHHNTHDIKQARHRLPHDLTDPLPAAGAKLALSKRTGRWEIRYTTRDETTGVYRSRIQATGTKNEVAAQERLREFQAVIREELGPDTAAPSPCVQPLLELYLAALEKQHPMRRIGQAKGLVWPRRLLGDMKPRDITKAVIERYVDTRRLERPIKDSSLRRELSALQAALNWAEDNSHIQTSDIPRIKLPAPGPAKDVWLNEATEARVHQAALDGYLRGPGRNPTENERRDMYLFLLIALNTAGRKTAILSLRWERVDMTARRIDFRDPERPITKKRRVMVPISKRLWPVLEMAQREANGEGRVFKHHTVQPTASLRTFAAKLGVPWLTPHVCRHTWATLAARAGVDLYQIAGVLGDTLATVTGNYLHHAPDHLVGAIDHHTTTKGSAP